MSSLEVDIRNIEADINLLEVFKVSTNSCDANSLALISLNNQHSALLKQNTIYWAQRARLMWVRYGDFNTSFFYNHASVRNQNNKISAILDDYSCYVTDLASIDNYFICLLYQALGLFQKSIYF